MKRLLLLLLLTFLVPALAGAQTFPGATLTQAAPSRLDAATTAVYSRTTGATMTLTAPAGQFVYMTGIDIVNCAGASAVGAATPTYITTTGLTGSPQWQVGSGVTAGLCTSSPNVSFSTPLKSTTAGTNVTVVLPTFATNQTVSVNVYYYTAP